MVLRTLGSHFWQPKALRVSLVALLLLGALLVVGAGHATPVAHASGGCECITFLHTATPANSAYDSTKLDEAGAVAFVLTNNPAAFLLVTPDINPGGGASVVFDNHPLGVFHDNSAWYIFNQDGAPMPTGAAFNVFAREFGFEYNFAGAFVQTATSANTTSEYTCIDDPHLTGQPSMRLFVTPNWNPGFAAGVYTTHPIGVFYNVYTGHWCIINQDDAPLLAGAVFNVWYEQPGFSNTTNTLQTVTSSNTSWGTTIITDASLNGNRGALLFVTSDINPGATPFGVYDNHTLGVGYDGTHWRIFNQDGASMPLGAAFFYDTF